jgi:hypothetical protein
MLQYFKILGTDFCLSRYRGSVQEEMSRELLLMPEVRPHAPMIARHLVMKLKLMIRAMVPEAKAMVLLTMAKMFLSLMLMNETTRCDWVVIFGL